MCCGSRSRTRSRVITCCHAPSPAARVRHPQNLQTVLACATRLGPPPLFYDGEKPPKLNVPESGVLTGWGSSGREAKTLHRFRSLMSRADESDVKLLLFMALKMTQRKNGAKRRGRGAKLKPAA